MIFELIIKQYLEEGEKYHENKKRKYIEA